MVECLPGLQEGLGLSPSTGKGVGGGRKGKEREGRERKRNPIGSSQTTELDPCFGFLRDSTTPLYFHFGLEMGMGTI